MPTLVPSQSLFPFTVIVLSRSMFDLHDGNASNCEEEVPCFSFGSFDAFFLCPITSFNDTSLRSSSTLCYGGFEVGAN